MSLEHERAWELLPDLAVGIDDEEDLEAVEQHAAQCEECTAALVALRAAVEALETSPAVGPPESLRSRVLAIPDEIPRTAPAAGAAKKPQRPRRGWLRPALAVAALALLLVGAGALYTIGTEGGGGTTLAMKGGPGAPDAWGTARLGDSDGVNTPAKVTVGGLDPVPDGGYYEAWLGTPDTRVSVGTLRVRDDGSGEVSLNLPDAVAADSDWLWITREPADGDPKWSDDMVLTTDLPAA